MQKEGKQVSRRWRTAAVLALGIVIGTMLLTTSAGAHVGGTVSHLWNKHIKPRADKRYVNVNEKRQLGVMRAQRDSDSGGSTESASTGVQVNSVSITAPAAGFLVISGHVFVNNNDAGTVPYVLNPKIDGTDVTAPGWGATFTAASAGSVVGELFELSYTTAKAVTAGAHTVTQDLGDFNGTARNFFWNNNELVVQWIPAAGNQGLVSRLPARSTTRSRMGG
jgi:hypothetical protein